MVLEEGCYSLPSSTIFQELQKIHDTGFFSPVHSLEEKFQQVLRFLCNHNKFRVWAACNN